MSAAPFVALTSRWRTGFLTLVALAFVGLSGWFVSFPDMPDRVIGTLGLLIFGGAASIGARQLCRTGPVLQIDDDGILWRRWSDTPIPWSAVCRVEVRTMQRRSFVCLFLRDPSAYPSTGALGWLAGANRMLGFGDVALSASGTDRSFGELHAAVAARFPVAAVD